MTRRNKPADPTAERTADQSTQSASGLSAGRPAPGDKGRDGGDADVMARRRAAKETPRRYDTEADADADAEDTQDPALPADDATLKTKI